MQRFLIAGRALLLMVLLLMPSIAILLIVAFLSGSTRWFGFIGLPALLLNAAAILIKPSRVRIWGWLGGVPGQRPAR